MIYYNVEQKHHVFNAEYFNRKGISVKTVLKGCMLPAFNFLRNNSNAKNYSKLSRNPLSENQTFI